MTTQEHDVVTTTAAAAAADNNTNNNNNNNADTVAVTPDVDADADTAVVDDDNNNSNNNNNNSNNNSNITNNTNNNNNNADTVAVTPLDADADDAVVVDEDSSEKKSNKTTTKKEKKKKKKKERTKKKRKKIMKVTLLSGFLGAGKTTLLKRILRANNNVDNDDDDNDDKKQPLKIAVIVNDMGEINLDAEEIRTSKIVREDAEMVEMHNGCICCTLRGDLLETVRRLAEDEKSDYDYLVIESTGISEPMPVAQTFAMNVDGMTSSTSSTATTDEDHHRQQQSETAAAAAKKKNDDKKSLYHYAKLDTLVTIVDALAVYDVLGSIETLSDENNSTGMAGRYAASASENGGGGGYGYSSFQAKQQHSAVVAAIRAMGVEQLRMALEANGLDYCGKNGNSAATTTGGGSNRDELASVLIDDFERRMEEEHSDRRPIVKLWLDQIEFANVIVVSKVPLFLEKTKAAATANGNDDGGAVEKKLRGIENLLRRLNPDAKILLPRSENYGDLDVLREATDTGLFNMRKAQKSLSWIRALEADGEEDGGGGHKTPETEEYGISSVKFVANDVPFHPERLHDILECLRAGIQDDGGGGGGYGGLLSLGRRRENDCNNHHNIGKNQQGTPNRTNEINENDKIKIKSTAPFRGVVRIKGQVWLATCNVFPLWLQVAGRHVELKPGGGGGGGGNNSQQQPLSPFLVEKPTGYWTESDRRAYEWLLDNGMWTEKWGDRRSQIVVIGVGLDPDTIRGAFGSALLTERELRSMEEGGGGGVGSGCDPADLWTERLNDPISNGRFAGLCKSYRASLHSSSYSSGRSGSGRTTTRRRDPTET